MAKRKSTLDPKTQELWALMRQHNLTTRAVGKLLGRSRQCVKRWTSEKTVVSPEMLDLLKYRIRDSLAGSKASTAKTSTAA